jgi:hypothetical protein
MLQDPRRPATAVMVRPAAVFGEAGRPARDDRPLGRWAASMTIMSAGFTEDGREWVATVVADRTAG